MPKVFETSEKNRRVLELRDQHGVEHCSLRANIRRIMVLIAHKAGWLSTVDPGIVRAYLFDRQPKAPKIVEDDQAKARVQSTTQKGIGENC